MRKIKNFHKGFTLIELLIVIAIIGVLATLLMVNFVGVRQRARDAQRKSDLRQLQSALEIYRSDNGGYPNPVVSSAANLFKCTSGTGKCVNSSGNCFGNDPSCTTIYMQNLPIDPNGLSPTYYNGGNYFYTSSDGSAYTLGACLENTGDSQGTSVSPGGSPACSSGTYYVLYNP